MMRMTTFGPTRSASPYAARKTGSPGQYAAGPGKVCYSDIGLNSSTWNLNFWPSIDIVS